MNNCSHWEHPCSSKVTTRLTSDWGKTVDNLCTLHADETIADLVRNNDMVTFMLSTQPDADIAEIEII